jgi:hypothetical protein
MESVKKLVNCFNLYTTVIRAAEIQTMIIVKHCFFLFFNYIYITLTKSEILPFFIHADQVFLKCPNGKLESFNNTTNIHSTCVQTTKLDRFNLFQLYIQCPDGLLHLEYNRTFTFDAQIPEYSMTSLQPHCFIDNANQYQNQLVPYRTRYTSENSTFTQILSFQCQNNSTTTTNEELYLFFKLINYGLCRYLIQFISSNGKCNRSNQQMYKIQVQVKNSQCYYQLGPHPSEIPLDYFDQMTPTNLSLNQHSLYSRKPVHRTIIIMTASITTVSLLLCLVIFITMYHCGLFRPM